MKKTYINPNMNVVTMKMTQHLLDSSNPQVGLDRTGGVSAGSVEGREFDFNDEEE